MHAPERLEEQAVFRRRIKDARRAEQVANSPRRSVEIATTIETKLAPDRPTSAGHRVRRDERRLGDLRQSAARKIRGVGRQIDGDDRQRAGDDGARQRAFRIRDFAGEKREIARSRRRPRAPR